MSGIPGLFRRDGRPADATVVSGMMGAAAHRGPDGARCWSEGPVALGHQLLAVTIEDRVERQPLIDRALGLAIAFDGRLDNRVDLVARLASGGPAPGWSSDAALVLAAYREWGEGCPGYLLGDFVFAIWDRRKRAVFCARDAMGVKPFYYALDDGRFVWGSELGQVLAAGVSAEPNEGMVAEYLARAVSSHTETLFRGVMRLPAAHSLCVTSDRVRVARYWQLDLSAEIAHEDDAEYAEHFASVFDEAVRCRLRADAPVGAYLSGGLDSSSVVGTALAFGAKLEAFSLVYPHMVSADETPYIDAVAGRWGMTTHKVAPQPIDGLACRAHVRRRKDVLDLPADHEGECLGVAMQSRGRRVVLTGVGGDYGLTGSFYHYADLLRARDWRGLVGQALADSRHPDIGWAPSQLFACGLRPLLPERWRSRVRPLARRLGWIPRPPEWIGKGLARRVGLEDRLRPPQPDVAVGSFSRRYVWDLFQSGWTYRLLETGERAAAELGIDERHPFFDRRVVELALALPESQRWRGQETKFILRAAMGDRLPASVRRRLDKADFSPVVPRAVEAVGGQGLLDDLRIAELGWVEQRRVSAMYRQGLRLLGENNEAYCVMMFNLWMIAGVELWYRSVFGDEVAHGPKGVGAGYAGRWQAEGEGLSASGAH